MGSRIVKKCPRRNEFCREPTAGQALTRAKRSSVVREPSDDRPEIVGADPNRAAQDAAEIEHATIPSSERDSVPGNQEREQAGVSGSDGPAGPAHREEPTQGRVGPRGCRLGELMPTVGTQSVQDEPSQ